ncbi:MAG TPA: proline/glycine betaine ABC transporter permease [Shinella sp.]|uniref:ABC transporter permease n=1 Tax=Shinella sp. TaxID=1870904 RepID=UPI0029AF6D8D|nr:proline/glycine betaine ABC transporter permease [Shinella sp.]MDX3974914.1 proline/glycine betaine ABC transporter permease [Shinella sp.]HEV7247925.1 proline/glycine betaine ABC transporter permease [Shinella sp.]
MANNFPEFFDTRGLRFAIDDGFSWVVANYGDAFEQLLMPLLKLLGAMETFLQWLPWYVTIAVIAALTYSASRSLKATAGAAVMLVFIGALGLWNDAMATIALMLAATVVAVAVGIPLGIAMARSDRLRSMALPLLDIMQTLPIFVYLIPFVMLFGPGKIPAILATVFFAIPPVIRLTDLGIRQVDSEVVEAIVAFGATPRQKLFKVQIPLALPTIMAGINQTTMMALSMVVIASMIGAGGLGYQVLQGIQRLEVSRGLIAGIAIVFLAVIFDRIAQSYGRRAQKHLASGE